MKATVLRICSVFIAGGVISFGQPTIITQPQDQLAIPGQTITLTVVASSAPLDYQWQRDDLPLAGKTNASLIFSNIQVVDAGNYSVAVRNSSGSTNSRVAAVAVIGPVPLVPKLSANIRLGDDPPQLPADRRAQTGPHIARSFTNPNLLAATFQEGRYENGGAYTCGYSVSTNGGLTWSRAFIPKLTAIDGGPGIRAFNPMAAIDQQDDIVLTCEISLASARGAMISKSSGGQWQALTTRQILTRSAGISPWLAVNTFPVTPNPNRLVLLFNHTSDRSHATSSDDGGLTWSAPQPAASSQGLYSQPLFLPDNSVANVYVHYTTPGALDDPYVPARLESVLSQNGGATFGAPTLVTPSLRPMYLDPIARSGWDPSRSLRGSSGGRHLCHLSSLGRAGY